MNAIERKKIVIVGAGFAGLKLARKLANTAYEVTVIDVHNYHQFQPLFYQVASARLEPSSISFPLRKIFQRKKNINIRLGKVVNIDTGQQVVYTEQSAYEYDYLAIATGCGNNYFGNKNIEANAFPMKSTPQANALRNKILLNFETSLSVKTLQEKEPFLTIVIVGGGPTGVELAGALAEMKNKILPKDYPLIDFSQLKIYLIEGSANTLSAMSADAQKYSRMYLEKMGVTIWTGIHVSDYDGETVKLEDGRTLRSYTMIWAAGVAGNVPPGIPKEAVTRGNRIAVNELHEVKAASNVYAIGDVSYMETKGWEHGHPQLANVANHQAENLANNFKNLLKGAPPKAFSYKNPGTMATVGKRKAVVDMPKFHFHGRFAWFVWMFLHLMLILGVRNRFLIFINWMFNYFTDDSTLRIILFPTSKEIRMSEDAMN